MAIVFAAKHNFCGSGHFFSKSGHFFLRSRVGAANPLKIELRPIRKHRELPRIKELAFPDTACHNLCKQRLCPYRDSLLGEKLP